MERIDLDHLEPEPLGAGSRRHDLTEALGTTDVAINRYRITPGEGFPGGLHAHWDQEEVFLVLDGVATFETLHGSVTVDTGEAIRFAPGEFQTGRNEAETDLVAIALGAPKESEDLRFPVACPACDHPNMRLDATGGVAFVCPECGVERVPEDCPDCGSPDREIDLDGDGDPVVVCRDCKRESLSPFVE